MTTMPSRGSPEPPRSAPERRMDRPGIDPGKLRKVKPRHLLLRFAMGAVVSVLAGLVGLALGPRVGGMFLAFPAMMVAALTLIEEEEGTSESIADVRGSVIGAIGMLLFATVVTLLTERSWPGFALILAALVWLLAGVSIYTLVVAVSHMLGEEQYLPEVPAHEAKRLTTRLEALGLTVALAESSSGGALTALLTAVRGAGTVVRGGVVPYDRSTKTLLVGISEELLATHGAVSAEAAVAMAEAAREKLGTDMGIAITGVTGDSSEGKPPGLVYIAATLRGGDTRVIELDENRGPEGIRAQALRAALRVACELLDASTVGAETGAVLPLRRRMSRASQRRAS